jgi:hypothetical protein
MRSEINGNLRLAGVVTIPANFLKLLVSLFLGCGAQSMKLLLSLFLCVLLLEAGPVLASQGTKNSGEVNICQLSRNKMDCAAGDAWCKSEEATCRPEMRGRCGKRQGDWYGARQPVVDVSEARGLLQNYFSGCGYTVSGITEKRWGFRAEIIDKDGKVVDRVMIDKRSGRIRSLY